MQIVRGSVPENAQGLALFLLSGPEGVAFYLQFRGLRSLAKSSW